MKWRQERRGDIATQRRREEEETEIENGKRAKARIFRYPGNGGTDAGNRGFSNHGINGIDETQRKAVQEHAHSKALRAPAERGGFYNFFILRV